MTRLPFLLTALVLVCLFHGSARAQVTTLPGTGCPGALVPTTVGTPSLGSGFGVLCPLGNPAAPSFVLLGLGGPPATLGAPLACDPRGCVLACRPVDVQSGSAWRGVVTNDPRLVGACFCVRCGEVQRAAPGTVCVACRRRSWFASRADPAVSA